jgi:type IV pilus assembly protein PilN
VIRINLLPVREVQREAGRRQETRLIYLVVTLLVVVLAAIDIGSRLRLAPLKREKAKLQNEIVALEKQAVEYTKLDAERQDLDEKVKAITTLEAKKVGPVGVLADLSNAAPEEVWLLEFKEAGGLATISGLGLDDQTIANFMRNLGKSRYFEGVDLVETMQSEQDGVALKRFVVNARLSYAGKDLGRAPRDLKFPQPSNGTKGRKKSQRKGNRA